MRLDCGPWCSARAAGGDDAVSGTLGRAAGTSGRPSSGSRRRSGARRLPPVSVAVVEAGPLVHHDDRRLGGGQPRRPSPESRCPARRPRPRRWSSRRGFIGMICATRIFMFGLFGAASGRPASCTRPGTALVGMVPPPHVVRAPDASARCSGFGRGQPRRQLVLVGDTGGRERPPWALVVAVIGVPVIAAAVGDRCRRS